MNKIEYTWLSKARFIRTCQSCDSEQESRDPATYKSDSWRDLKCKKCRSEDLDYGTWKHDKDCKCHYCLAGEEW